jgi:hypothetical protein
MAKSKVETTLRLAFGDVSPRRVLSKQIAQEITGQAVTISEEGTYAKLRTMARKMSEAGNAEAKRLMPFITRFMMNIRSRNAGTVAYQAITADDMEEWADQLHRQSSFGVAPRGTLHWRSLSPSWMKSKGFKKPFFAGKTGALKRALTTQSAWPQTTLGGVQVQIRREGLRLRKNPRPVTDRKFLIGLIEVQIFPGARGGAFPGLATGNWAQALSTERAPGLDPAVIKKLNGPTNSDIAEFSRRRGRQSSRGDGRSAFFRPMVTPAAQFWALYRIPQAIRVAALGSLSRVKRGVADFNTIS